MREELSRISNVFFQDSVDEPAIHQACQDYKTLLLQISGINLSGISEQQNINLTQGESLGTAWAAQCLDDYLRTKKFISGAYKAVLQVLKKNAGRPVHLLYAGTGPFAALILPLTCVFSPEQLQFTLIEINPLSFQSLKRITAVFGLDKYVRNLALDDATHYQIPADETVDILLSETMQAGLRKEMQVPIFYHFLSQTGTDQALIIPQSIRLYLGLSDSREAKGTDIGEAWKTNYLHLGCYFELSKKNIITDLKKRRQALVPSFPWHTFTIPVDSGKHFSRLALFTEIDVFGDEKLIVNQSGLTVPLMISDLLDSPLAGTQIKIAYSLKGTPGELIEFSDLHMEQQPNVDFFSE